METHELVGLTLDKLLDHFKVSPESFDYTDNGCPTVVWRPKIQMGDITSNSVNDPNNTHAVVVKYYEISNEMVCYIFLKHHADLSNSLHHADSTTRSKLFFQKWRSNYKKLMQLKRLIELRNEKKANMIYLRKLSSVFPDTLDDSLL